MIEVRLELVWLCSNWVNLECCILLIIEVFELMEWRKNIVINYIEIIWWCFIECYYYSGGRFII